MRVHELAKEFGMSSKELLDKLQAMKIPAKNHASTLVEAYVDKIRKALGPEIAERQAAMEIERLKREEEERIKREAEEAKLAAEQAARAAEEAAAAAEEQARREREEEEARHRAEEETRRRAEAEAKRLEAEAESARRAEEARKAEEAAKVEAAEAERYRQMARQAEEAQKKSGTFVAPAIVEAARQAATPPEAGRGRGKKGKQKGRREAAAEAAAAAPAAPLVVPVEGASLTITEGSNVGDFATLVGLAPNEIIKRLMMLGEMMTVNQPMPKTVMEVLADDLGYELRVVSPEEEVTEEVIVDLPEDLLPKPPVVTVMGHVDHGKTSLLDAIRSTGVAATEAGGITQHIGASVVRHKNKQITFIDTPGHEAFTAMRARGANVTDVVILVVAADDGVMPQTVEAIDHAKAAGVPIVVAVNKIDKDNANPERVRQELVEKGVIPEEWGGTNIFVDVSAKKHENIDDLLEMVLLVADVQELKANPNAAARGVVIEAKLDRGRGPVATVLVQRGTLKVGDAIVAGLAHGRVRALYDPKGNIVDEAKPSDAVEVLGLSQTASGGDEFKVMPDDRAARQVAEERALKRRLLAEESVRKHVSLDDLFARIKEGELQDLNLVVKADAQGSIEALKDALSKMDQSEVRVNVLHSGVGGITETDVDFADASDAIIIGFNVRPEPKAKTLAEQRKVDLRLYRVIYQAIEDINAARVGMLAPTIEEHDTARVEVRELFRVPKIGLIAGCYVQEGEITRDDQVRIVRQGTIIFDGKLHSLRRFKDDAKSVRQGYECGIGIEGFQDLKEGDIIEGYKTVEVAREE